MAYNDITLRKWQTQYKNINDLIVQASTYVTCDSWQPFPIGMQFNYYYNYDKGVDIQIGSHSKTVLSAFEPSTDKWRRPNGFNRYKVADNLSKNSIINKVIDHAVYFKELPNYKFVISPEGNGLDCHRHYEALIAGCIPVMEHNSQIEEKFKGCPVLYTTDYSEITEEYLLIKYNEMIDVKYDFSRLFLSHYDENIQRDIKRCGNFWMNQCVKEVWYK